MTGVDRKRSLLIVGLGNSMMGDDGTGPAVVNRLTLLELPPSVSCRELSDVLHLPAIWSEENEVWMVDAVVAGAAPGTIHRLGHEQVLGLTQPHDSAHHLGLAEGLNWILHAHPEMRGVRFRLLGVEPRTVAPVESLSVIVEKSVRRLVREISDAVNRSL